MCREPGPIASMITSAQVAGAKSKMRKEAKQARQHAGQRLSGGATKSAGTVVLVCSIIVCLALAHTIMHILLIVLAVIGAIVATTGTLAGVAWWKRNSRPAPQVPMMPLDPATQQQALPWQGYPAGGQVRK